MWSWKEIGAISFHAGGIRRRLLVWNLSLFGSLLFGIFLSSNFYNQRQIKDDSFEWLGSTRSSSKNWTTERLGSFDELPSGWK